MLHRLLSLAFVASLLGGCATTYDLPEKYAGVIGHQYRTREDAYLWKEAAHQYEFVPYKLANVGGYHSEQLELIPSGSIVTVKAAKRSYSGGDWDYLIAEVRGPKSGTVYTFEEMLGFSSYYPGNVARRWEPMDKAHTPLPLPNGDFFTAPNGRFSINQESFPGQLRFHQVWESNNPSAIEFIFDGHRLVRIEYCTAPRKFPSEWMAKSNASNPTDRMIDGVVAFVGTKTPGLQEFKPLLRRESATLGEKGSAAVCRMFFSRGDYSGLNYRGFLTFIHGADTFLVHYQTPGPYPDDNAAAQGVLATAQNPGGDDLSRSRKN